VFGLPIRVEREDETSGDQYRLEAPTATVGVTTNDSRSRTLPCIPMLEVEVVGPSFRGKMSVEPQVDQSDDFKTLVLNLDITLVGYDITR